MQRPVQITRCRFVAKQVSAGAGGVEPLGEVAIAGETLTVAATRGYRINTVEIGGRTVEVNGRAFTVTAAEALECAPLQMMVNLYPSPFVIIIR